MIGTRAIRSGFTLAELMVVIMVLGVMAAVTVIAFATRTPLPVLDLRMARVAAARDSAVRTGKPVTVQFDEDSSVRLATAYPDGRVVADAPLRGSRLSGRGDRAGR
jgi:prepilin-type N-terminal cleavage/methylation domain-containing protein